MDASTAKSVPDSGVPATSLSLLDQGEILDRLVAGTDLRQVLDALVRLLEGRLAAGGTRCSILLLEGDRLRNGASPHLPADFIEAIDGEVVGPDTGACGAAVHRRQRVVVEDTLQDPLWRNYRELARQHGLRACWSEPIFGHQGRVLGTLAMYYREPRPPTAEETDLIAVGARLAAVTLMRWQDQRELRQSRERLRLALSASGLGMWDWDLRSGAVHADARYVRIFGGDPHDFVPHIDTIQALQHPDDLRRSTQVVADHIRGRTPAYFVRTRFRTPDGGWRWVATFGQVTERDAQGRATRLSGTSQDVDEQVRADEERRRLTEQLQLLMESTDEGICGLDAAGRCTFVNRAVTHLLGYAPAELLGRDFVAEVVCGGDLMAGAVAAGERLPPGEYELRRKDRTLLAARCSLSPIMRDGQRSGAVLVFSDVSVARELSQRLARNARQDALTGLANRRAFELRLRQLVDDARRHRHSHAVIYVDLDQFKLVNDSCGHAGGDRLLQQLPAVLGAGLAEGDLLARLGGDEFGLLLAGADAAQAMDRAESMLARLRDFEFEWRGRKFGLSASIGVAPVTADTPEVSEVLVAADAACFVAKEAGRNRVHLSLPDDQHVLRHRDDIRWVGRLREALREDRFRLLAEPLADLRDPPGRIRHFEVLARIQEPSGDLITPGAFIPSAERYQLVAEVDLHLLRRLLHFLGDLRPGTVEPQTASFALNLSGGSLGSPGLLDAVHAEIRNASVAAACLSFEITETAAIANLEQAVRWMGRLKDLGCRFALDDFGSGLSSYAYLRSLPVDTLKIDGSFIRRLDQDPLSRAIVHSINEVGHQMGLRTVAEHVETEAVLAAVREAGVDYAQGYAVGRGVLLDELAGRLTEG